MIFATKAREKGHESTIFLAGDAVVLMLERGFRHLPLTSGAKVLGVFSIRDALPREIGTAVSLTEFREQVNDALG